LGVDDAPFTFAEPTVRLVGVVTQGAQYVEGVLSAMCAVDGTDATDAIAAMTTSSRFAPTLRCMFLNGVAVGGFNVVDLDRLHATTGVPVVAVARREPDRAAIEAALTRHVADPDDRLRLLGTMAPVRVAHGGHDLWVSHRGLDEAGVKEALTLTKVRGALPEPLRLAHVIASGIERGESRGKA
jgi:endonuclease V-like protein UPF0215 family